MILCAADCARNYPSGLIKMTLTVAYVSLSERQNNAPDILGRVDDLLDARHAQRDVHGRHAGEVEGLQGHLCAWLPNALGAQGPHGRAGLHLCPVSDRTVDRRRRTS